MTVPVLHMTNRPVGHSRRKLERLLIIVGEVRKRLDRLRGTLAVDWPRLIVIVARTAILAEEVSLIEGEPADDRVTVCVVTSRVDVTFQAVEVVAGVKIVDPVKLRWLRVPPRAVGTLPRTAVPHRLFRWAEVVVCLRM